MKPKHPVGPPMTLGNMRELGVRANERQYAFRGAAFPRLMPRNGAGFLSDYCGDCDAHHCCLVMK
jgi:hypothetical protein